MRIGGERVRCKVEVQLRFEPQDVARLINARSGKSLIVDAQRSRMRIYSHVEPASSPAVIHPAEKRIPESNIRVLMEAPLSGEMRIMPHAATRGFWRAAGALWSWFRNRGLRDIVGKIRDRLTAKQSRPPGSSWLKDICDWARSAWNLASHAGDRRLIEYELTLGQPVALPKSSPVAALSWNGKGFKATKTLTYERSGNPLNQLIYAKVLETPKVAGLTLREDLKVDLPYFGRVGAPLRSESVV